MNHQEIELMKRLVEAIESIDKQLGIMNDEGVVIFMGTDHLEN